MPGVDFSVTDLVDVVIVAGILWAGLVWLRRTRARLALLGMGMIGAVYLVARSLDLALTAWLLQGFFAVFVIVLVVVFQEDLRRLFEQIAVWGLRRRVAASPPDAIDAVVRACRRLAETRQGALIVIPADEPLERHIEGGIALDAHLSEPLLLSLFDPHSPGHDGAVIVTADRATRFAVHLPLSTDRAQLGPGGTRHAAALGLAERTDALCIVVSEERGTISIARDGRLRILPSAQALAAAIRSFLADFAPARASVSRWRGLAASWREGLIGVALAAALWAALVPGAGEIQLQREAPVVVENLPPGYELESIEPDKVKVTLSGRWRDLYFGEGTVSVRIDALLAQLGRRTFQLSPEQVDTPDGLEAVDVKPDQVRLSLRRAPAAAPESPPSSG